MWVGSFSVAAQKSNALVGGAKAGIPWTFETSLGGTQLWEDGSAADAFASYQLMASGRFVFQPLAWAWFQTGLQSASTRIPEATSEVNEPVSLSAIANVEIIPAFLYANFGFAFSFFEETLPLEDSAALFDFQNGYRYGLLPLGLNVKTLFGGTFLRQDWGPWLLLTGFSMGRSAPVTLYEDHTFTPPHLINGSFRLRHRKQDADHRIEIAATYFSEEKNAAQEAAHQEGMRWYFRYSLTQLFNSKGLEVALGGVWHAEDKNRRLLIRSELEHLGTNDNLQRIFVDGTWIWRVKPKWLAHLYLRPSLVFQAGADSKWGYETEVFLRSRMRFFGSHDFEVAPGALLGRFHGQPVAAVAFRAKYAFHHLPAINDEFAWESVDARK